MFLKRGESLIGNIWSQIETSNELSWVGSTKTKHDENKTQKLSYEPWNIWILSFYRSATQNKHNNIDAVEQHVVNENSIQRS